MAKAKLKDLLSEVFEETQKVDKYKVSEGVRNFGIVGKSLYNNNNIMKVAEQLAGIAEQAHHHILGEQDDWFDKISVNKNMKHLKGSVMEFQKTAKEAHMLNQRLTGLYEDIGHVLNRYYEISEGDKGDMDNDGVNEPDDKEFMDNKDKAIKQAMNKEALDMDKAPDGGGDEEDYAARDGEDMKEVVGNSVGIDPKKSAGNNPESPDGEARDDSVKEVKRSLKDVGGVVGIPALGQFVKKFR